ncbi:hypothetical protein [Spirosoma fluminis]
MTTYQLPNRRAKVQYCNGIDPDKVKSGFASYDRKTNTWVRYEALEPLPLLRASTEYKVNECEFFVEAGWQNQGMNTYQMETLPAGFARWPALRQWAYMFERGVSVGTNFGAGYWIISILKALNYTVHEYRPRTAKWDAKHLKLYTGITGRTNQDVRDSIRAAYLNR